MDAGSMVIEGSSMMSVFNVTLELYEAIVMMFVWFVFILSGNNDQVSLSHTHGCIALL